MGVEAGVILEREAVGKMASVVYRSRVSGVTPVARTYKRDVLFDTFSEVDDIRKATDDRSQSLKIFLGPAIRLGIFENVMGSEIVYLASSVVQKIGRFQALLGPELDFWELLAAATL